MTGTALRLAALAATIVPMSAWAHPGHGGPRLAEGFVHPLSGLDHLAAMLLVGIVAARLFGRSYWIAPALFLAGLFAGFATGAMLAGAWIEPVIVLSFLVPGAVLFVRREVPMTPAAIIIALFGYAHGTVHGIEMPSGAMPGLYFAGFMTSSVLLHGAGYWLACILRLRARRSVRPVQAVKG